MRIVATFVAALLATAFAQQDGDVFKATFPIEIRLVDSDTEVAIQRPVGIVAGLDTTMYVASEAGELFITDVRSGIGRILNPGGDDQRFGGLCLDSRGPGTLYATGRDSGVVFAFNRRGELLRRYQITTPVSQGGTAFLTGCIQTQYQLLIIDSNSPFFYFLKLADVGPLRGHPPPLAPTTFQGSRRKYEGDWVQRPSTFNAYGVEWTQKFEKQVSYVLNSATGDLMTMTVKSNDVIPNMQNVQVMGRVNKFPGALGILYDSTNENILYITMPHLNAIAAVEVSRTFPRRAKFIRYLDSVLIDGPIGVGEFGNWIYPICGNFRRGLGTAGAYTIVQVPRHRQILESNDPDDEFTTSYDDIKDKPRPVVTEPDDILTELKGAPRKAGKSAPAPIQSNPEDDTAVNPLKTPEPGSGSGVGPTQTPTPGTAGGSSGGDSGTEDGGSSDSSDNSSEDGSSTFGIANDEGSKSTGDDGTCFPSSAVVTTSDGRHVRMDRLRIGDHVMVGEDESGAALFSDVFMFSHQDSGISSEFVSIDASHGEKVELSPEHYLYVNGQLATASSVKSGDTLWTRNSQVIRALAVSRVRRRGLFNPQTRSGDIVVNGLKVSTYTSAVEPVTAAALMAPLRAAYGCRSDLPRRISGWLATGSGGIARWLPTGRSAYL